MRQLPNVSFICKTEHVRQVIVARALHAIIGAAACAFTSLCVPPRTRPLPLQCTTPMRVISFVRTHPRRSWLQHHQEPDRVRIRIAVRAPARVPPPAAARGPAEGYFIHANASTAVPGTHPSQSGAPGFALSRVSAAFPGHAFAPLSATGLGSGQAGTSPEICITLT